MGSLGRDVRFALRTLRKSPGFTAVALLTLALGIGANTAIFSVVNAVLLSPLPYRAPDRLVAVLQTLPAKGVSNAGLSYLNFSDFAREAHAFEGLAAVRLHDYTLTGQGEPALVVGGSVTATLFPVLGGRAMLGRGLTPSDDEPEAPPVAVLSERLWRERFGADPAVLGRVVTLDARPATIVGVMPATFKTPPEAPPTELWVTLAHDPVFGDLKQKRAGHYLKIVGRLKNGVSIGQAQSELATIGEELAREYPAENEGWGVRLLPLAESLVGDVRRALLVLLGAVGLVFLIACANVANLLLARASARGREVAIRAALGAGRGRLIGQLGTECLVLGLAGGALGLSAAWASLKAVKAWLPADLPRVSEIGLDARVLLFSLAASLGSAVVFGLAPVLQLSGGRVWDALKEGALGSGESGRRIRMRSVLVVAETAVSFMLLIGAGLLTRSFLKLSEVDPGFRAAHVLTAGLSLPRNQYSKPEEWRTFYAELVARLRAEPGVDGVAAALPLPLTGSGLNFSFQVEGRAPEKAGNESANYTAVTPEYFRVMSVRVVAGRFLAEADTAESERVCLVSEAFVRRYFPGESPLGRRLVFGFTKGISREIVGIVGDVRRDGLGSPSQPEMYVPFTQDPWWAAYLAIRAKGDPGPLSAAVRRHVKALDPTLPIAAVEPMGQFVTDSVAQPRFRTTLLGLFAATALVLSLIGLYGVVSYNVGQRTREVGLRMALGAQARDVTRLILAHGLGLAGLGLAAGLAGAILVTRSLSGLLFGVAPVDPATYAGVAVLFLAAGLAACYVPARRAMRVDPVQALRAE